MMVPMQKEKRMEFCSENLEMIRTYPGIFAVSDFYAVELMRFLMGYGIRIPEDMVIVGFDDTRMCEMVSPTLTSVRQDVFLRARIAVKKLQELNEKKETETEVRLPVKLMERESTG